MAVTHRLATTAAVLSLLALGLQAAPARAAANLVADGSFEDGFVGWMMGGTTGDGYPPADITYSSATGYPTGAFGEAVPANNAATGSPDPVGNHAGYFVSDFATNQSLSQMVFLAPGTYQIGFSAYLPHNGYANAGDASFMGEVAGVTLANFSASSGVAGVWQTYDGMTTITTAGIYAVDFVFDTELFPSKDVVIDQVYIIAVDPPIPEPASIGLLSVGLAGLGLMRRKRAG
jgi:hypothetical protein